MSRGEKLSSIEIAVANELAKEEAKNYTSLGDKLMLIKDHKEAIVNLFIGVVVWCVVVWLVWKLVVILIP